MAVRQHGFTRVSALGPIAALFEDHGAAMIRVLADVDLPYSLLDHPDLPIPLKEQFKLLDRAAREMGEPHFGAKLGQYIRADKLSAFGEWVCRSDNLEEAIKRASKGLNQFLQTGTELTFERGCDVSRWSIEFFDPESQGRYQNELLGVSYLIDTVRCYAGDNWVPPYVATTCSNADQTAKLETLFQANVCVGRPLSTIEFPTELLVRPPARLKKTRAFASSFLEEEPKIPSELEGRDAIIALTRLALLQEYPRVEWVAGKMGLTRRTLQRRLRDVDTTFSEITDRVMSFRARELIGGTATPITDIALMLGYKDPAHFSRAFKRWNGISPTAFRSEIQAS